MDAVDAVDDDVLVVDEDDEIDESFDTLEEEEFGFVLGVAVGSDSKSFCFANSI